MRSTPGCGTSADPSLEFEGFQPESQNRKNPPKDQVWDNQARLGDQAGPQACCWRNMTCVYLVYTCVIKLLSKSCFLMSYDMLPRLGNYLHMLDLSCGGSYNICFAVISNHTWNRGIQVYTIHMHGIYLIYTTIMLHDIYRMRFESPNRDRTILYIENTQQRHLHIRIDKNVVIFGNRFPEIYLVHTWYIPCKSIYLVYARYIPWKSFLEVPDENLFFPEIFWENEIWENRLSEISLSEKSECWFRKLIWEFAFFSENNSDRDQAPKPPNMFSDLSFCSKIDTGRSFRFWQLNQQGKLCFNPRVSS